MITPAELAQMRERIARIIDRDARIYELEACVPRLIREVEELTKENIGLREIGTRLLTIRDEKMKTIEELRAALRNIERMEERPASTWRQVFGIARAALGESIEGFQ